MKIFNYVLICAWATVLISCNNEDKTAEPTAKTETAITQPTNNLAGHVYDFGPDIDTTKCEVLAECDCCSDDFLFLSDKDFIRIGYCVAEKTVIKGTYSFDQENVIFNYDSLYYFTEADENNEIKTVGKGSSEYLIKVESGQPFLDTLTKFICKQTLFYKNAGEKSFGTISSKDSINTYIEVLKKEGFWKKMNL